MLESVLSCTCDGGGARFPGSEMERLLSNVIFGLTIENRTKRMLYYRARSEPLEGLVMEIYEGEQRSEGGLLIPPDTSALPKG